MKSRTQKAPDRKFVKRDKPTPAPVAAPTIEKEKGKKTYNVLRGMRDILPKEEKYWAPLNKAAEKNASFFQFGRIETPLLEEASLFVRSIGKGTDVVDKEMYIFADKDGTRVALRPEGTASVVRAYIGNGLWNNPQPVKVWYSGPMFRHDRPQAGRYRQFYQIGFETLGIMDPAADAELLLVAYNLFKDIGLPVEIHINSIGTLEERERYINELTSYYRSKRSYLCEQCRLRLTKNPLRLLDCKEEGCQPVKEAAPQIIDWLEESSKNHFMKVLEYLDELSIPYLLTPTLVRGLDYYTHTVFEFYTVQGEEGAQSALGGGGRYDMLVEALGGRSTPTVGFSLGADRIEAALKRAVHENRATIAEPTFDIFFAQLGEEGKRRSLRLINELRDSGIKIAFNFFKSALKNQLEIAHSLQVRYVIILGQKEVQDKTVIIRDMESGVQEVVDQKKLESVLKKKLSTPAVVIPAVVI